MKPKVLLVVDETPPTPWAFWFSAQDMVKFMSNDFDFKVIGYRDDLKSNSHDYDSYDLVYLFGHYMNVWMPDNFNFKKSCAGVRAEFGYCDNKNPQGYPDDPWQDPKNCKEAQHILIYPSINVVSDILYERFKNFHPHTYNVCHGVDVNFFTPKPSYARNGGTFTFGWAGSPTNPLKNIVMLRKVISDCNEELKHLGYNLILKEAHYGKNYLSREQMRDFYQSLDCYVLPSKTEGTSATTLEAMSCGLPIISTKTGGWIELHERTNGGYSIGFTEEDLKEAVKSIIRLDEEQLFRMGKDNRKEMLDNWRWEIKARLFTKFFNETIEMYRNDQK